MWRIARTNVMAQPRALVQQQPVRHHAPICGPPRNPMSGAQKLIMGGGMMLIMMIIPYYCLFQTPRWSAMHRGVPFERDEEQKRAQQKKEEEAEAAAESKAEAQAEGEAKEEK